MIQNKYSATRLVTLAISGVLILIALICIPQMFTIVEGGEIVVIRHINGTQSVHTEPGFAYQGMGRIRRLQLRDQFSFSSKKDQGKPIDESIGTQFNGGGHAQLSGTIDWAMPLNHDKILTLVNRYGSMDAIEQTLIRPSMQKVIFNTGPLMTAMDSSGARRNEIPGFIDDQLNFGLYVTRINKIITKDPVTKEERSVDETVIVRDEKTNKPVRESLSTILSYGIVLSPVAINDIAYDDPTKKQIAARQQSIIAVDLAKAATSKAEQDLIQSNADGAVKAANARWVQETANAKTVAEADARIKIAEANEKAARLQKQADILQGEGQARARELVMNADGALSLKLDAWKEVNIAYAEAISKAQPGAWTPMFQSGGSSGSNSSSTLVEMLMMKTAKDLKLETMPKSK